MRVTCYQVTKDLQRYTVPSSTRCATPYSARSRGGTRPPFRNCARADSDGMDSASAPSISPAYTLQGHADFTNYCDVTPDGSVAISTSKDNTARVWDLAGGGVARAVLRGHSHWVWQCALSADGAIAATASSDGTVRVWDAESGEQLYVMDRCSLPRSWSCVKPDRENMLFGWGCALSADGSLLVGLFNNREYAESVLVVVDWQRHKIVASIERPRYLYDCAMSRDVTTIAFVWEQPDAGKFGVEVVDRQGNSLVEINCGGDMGLAISDSGSHVAVGDTDRLRFYEVEGNGRPSALLRQHYGKYTNCAMSSNGSYVVATAPNNSYHVRDRSTWSLIATLHGHTDDTRGCAISNDGSRIVTCSSDNTVRVWHLPITTPVKTSDHVIEAALNFGTAELRSVRVLLLGGSTRGKTSTVESLLGHAFEPNRCSTKGVDLKTHCLVPGSRGLSGDEIEERVWILESFASAVSRASLCNRVDAETISDSQVAPVSTDVATGSRYTGSASGSQSAAVELGLDEGVSPSKANNLSGQADVLQNVIESARAVLDSHGWGEIRGVDGRLLRIWDFGGQKEYETSHQFFISQRSVIVFVIDLERLCDGNTRDEELAEFFRCVQDAFTMSESPETQHIVVVGTRKNGCANVNQTWEALKTSIAEWSQTVYNAWVKRPTTGGAAMMKMIALENDGAVEDPEGSGLLALEQHLWSITGMMLEKSKPVPLRWRAFVEQLGTRSDLFLTKGPIMTQAADFPGFQQTSDSVEVTVLQMLRYFRDLGELVLFEVSEMDWIVFLHPENLLGVLRSVIGPSEVVMDRLNAQQKLDHNWGIIDVQALDVLWEDVPKLYRLTMLVMLCSFDLLVRLEWHESGRQVIGIPVLMRRLGSDGALFLKRMGRRRNEQDLEISTVFTEFFPQGLIGVLIANLHRSLGRQKTAARDFRADAMLLSLDKGERVFVRYMQERQGSRPAHIQWVFRGRAPVGIAHRCLRQFDKLIHSRLRKTVSTSYKHLLFSDCSPNLSCCRPKADEFGSYGHGCGESGSVEFEIKSHWVSSTTQQTELPLGESQCNQGACLVDHDHGPVRDPGRNSLANDGLEMPNSSLLVDFLRVDLFLVACGAADLPSLASTERSQRGLFRSIIDTVIARVKQQDVTRSPSVYSSIGCALTGSGVTEVGNAIRQTRGRGVALFVLTSEFFAAPLCIAQLLTCLHYAEEAQNDQEIRIRLVCLESSFDAILNDNIVREHFVPLKDRPSLSGYWVHIIPGDSAVATSSNIADIAWEAWAEPENSESETVLGRDQETSFHDLLHHFFTSDYLPAAKLVFNNSSATDIQSVYATALDNRSLGYNNIGLLRKVTRIGPAHRFARTTAALNAYEQKWLKSRRWDWGDAESEIFLRNVELGKQWLSQSVATQKTL